MKRVCQIYKVRDGDFGVEFSNLTSVENGM